MIDHDIISSSLLMEPLTRREKDVLALLAQNLTDREIADQLILSINSVKWYARRIYEKLEVENRQKAVQRARELGLFSKKSSLKMTAHNLPHQLTHFIGRKKEILQVVELVSKYCLVTLTGSGGGGKTRLALSVAQQLLKDFPDGVRYIELAPLSNPQHITQAVMDAVGIWENEGSMAHERLIFYFSNRQVLLVLDNCEHLIDECARLVHTLLQAVPELKVLATSREPLGIPGEVIFRVPSLPLPPENAFNTLSEQLEYGSIQLFLDRAQAVAPGFQLNDQNVTAVVQICKRLDGIPLAIELAASRVSSLGVGQIADRLDEAFRLLTGGGRISLERHRTLRSAIDWSYQLISEHERILLRRLGVFIGGWRLEAAESVCTGEGISEEMVLNLLISLVNKSLVLADPIPNGEIRYRMLETIRQYSLEELYRSGESERLRQRHFEWVLGLTSEAEPFLYTGKRLEWMRQLKTENGNLLGAIEWSLEEGRDPQGGLKILIRTGKQYWIGVASVDAYHLMEKGLEQISTGPTPSLGLQIRTMLQMAKLLFCTSSTLRGKDLLEKALSLCEQLGDKVLMERAEILSQLGLTTGNEIGDLQAGLEMVTEAEGILRAMGPEKRWDLALALSNKTWLLRFLGHKAEAKICCDESNALFLEVGDVWGGVYWQMAEEAQRNGDFGLAESYCEKEEAKCREADDGSGAAHISRILANFKRTNENYVEAHALYRNALKIFDNMASMTNICLTLGGIASTQVGIAMTQEADESRRSMIWSVRVLAGILTAHEAYHTLTFFEDRLIYDQALEKAKNTLDPIDFQTAWREGSTMQLKQVIKLANAGIDAKIDRSI